LNIKRKKIALIDLMNALKGLFNYR
jgi:hypothetical protein